MIYLALAVALLLFVAMLRLGRVIERSASVVVTVRGAASVMTSSTLSDDEKETRIQHDALAMLRAFAMLGFWSVAAIALSVLAVVLGSQIGLYSLDKATATASSWEVIVVASLIMTVFLVVRRR